MKRHLKAIASTFFISLILAVGVLTTTGSATVMGARFGDHDCYYNSKSIIGTYGYAYKYRCNHVVRTSTGHYWYSYTNYQTYYAWKGYYFYY